MTGVQLNAISKSFGRVPVLHDISLTIEPGELFFLLGPSGCGKTTLLRIIAGFTAPTEGTVFFAGTDMSAVPPNRRNTGMVFQNYALWPHMTVAQNISFGLDIRKLPSREKKKRIARALELVHMPGYEERYPHQLSGGQQQRVALARALVIEPDVVLLDEPLSNLDAGLRIEMRKEIHRIHEELGLTMVYVTHDQKESLSLATRMAVIDQGQLAQVDTPTEVYQNPASVFVARFVGETNLLDGFVRAASTDELELETDAGRLTCPSSRAAAAFTTGDRVTVSIRPEGIECTESQLPNLNTWKATVVESTYLGEVVQIVCRIGEKTLRITSLNPAGRPPSAGDTQILTINSAHVRILEPEK
jgi:iron(III) transport system ATP-binding protein